MGNSKSKKSSALVSPFAKKYKEHLKAFPKVQIAVTLLEMEKDIATAIAFYGLFCQMDTDSSGSISLIEFHAFLEVEMTPFSEKMFSSLGLQSKFREMHFDDFLINVWNYGTMNAMDIIHFVFQLYNDDGNGILTMSEMNSLVRMMYNVETLSFELKRKIKRADSDGDGYFSFEEFTAFSKREAKILQPAFDLQRRLRVKSFPNTNIWSTEIQKRTDQLKLQSIEDIFFRFEEQKHLYQTHAKLADLETQHRTLDAQLEIKQKEALKERKRLEKEYQALQEWINGHQEEPEFLTFQTQYEQKVAKETELRAADKRREQHQSTGEIDESLIKAVMKLRHELNLLHNRYVKAKEALETKWSDKEQEAVKMATDEANKLADIALVSPLMLKKIKVEAKNRIKRAKENYDPIPSSQEAVDAFVLEYRSNKIKAAVDLATEQYRVNDKMIIVYLEKLQES